MSRNRERLIIVGLRKDLNQDLYSYNIKKMW